MDSYIKTNYHSDGSLPEVFLTFLDDTKDGRYTDEKPIDIEPSVHRLRIPEQESCILIDDQNEEFLLYGISY